MKKMPSFRWIGEKKPTREQSPLYTFSDTDLTNGESLVVSTESAPYRKYQPYNFCQIDNSSDKDMTVQIGTRTVTVRAGTIVSFDEETMPAFNSVVMTNDSGANSTGDVEILIQKVKSYREVIKQRL